MHGVGTKSQRDGSSVSGDFRHSRVCGHGRKVFTNGEYYVGDFENDRYLVCLCLFCPPLVIQLRTVRRRSGMGQYVWTNGLQYNGEWTNGCMHGIGVSDYKFQRVPSPAPTLPSSPTSSSSASGARGSFGSAGLDKFSTPSSAIASSNANSGSGTKLQRYSPAVITQIKTLHYLSEQLCKDPVMKYAGMFARNRRCGLGSCVCWNGDVYLGEWGRVPGRTQPTEPAINVDDGCILNGDNIPSGVCSDDTVTPSACTEPNCFQGWGKLISESNHTDRSDRQSDGGEPAGVRGLSSLSQPGEQPAEADFTRSVYIGEFVNGVKHGFGTLYFGSPEVSVWKKYTINTPLEEVIIATARVNLNGGLDEAAVRTLNFGSDDQAEDDLAAWDRLMAQGTETETSVDDTTTSPWSPSIDGDAVEDEAPEGRGIIDLNRLLGSSSSAPSASLTRNPAKIRMIRQQFLRMISSGVSVLELCFSVV
jgi:hypothetical protein